MPEARTIPGPVITRSTGELTAGDEDWVAIELKAGTVYTITVSTRHTEDTDNDDTNDAGGLNDSILTVYDAKGGMVDMNDDIDGAMGDARFRGRDHPGCGRRILHRCQCLQSKNPESGPNMGGYTVMVAEIGCAGPECRRGYLPVLLITTSS